MGKRLGANKLNHTSASSLYNSNNIGPHRMNETTFQIEDNTGNKL